MPKWGHEILTFVSVLLASAAFAQQDGKSASAAARQDGVAPGPEIRRASPEPPRALKIKEKKCTYAVARPVTVIIRGAASQLLTLTSMPGCNFDERKIPAEFPLALTDSSNTGTVINGRKIEADLIELGPIPADIPTGRRSWNLSGIAGEPISSAPIAIEVSDLGVVDPRQPLRVRYSNAAIDRQQSGRSSANEQNLQIAVVNPLAPAEGDNPVGWGKLLNAASLTIPTGLQVVSDKQLNWVIQKSSWDKAARFRCANGEMQSENCVLSSVAQIEFSVRERRVDPLRVWLALQHGGYDPWFTVPVTLAGESRFESIPAPVANALRVGCNGDDHFGNDVNDYSTKVPNGAMRAIKEGALPNGQCYLAVYRERLPKPQEDQQDVALYGPQTIDVIVHRDGAASDGHLVWTFNLEGGPQTLPLPVPQSDQQGNGPYIVTARGAASGAQAVYRSGTSPLAGSGGALSSPEYNYSALLRSRGPFGFGRSYRMFVTIPVNITGLRFPASPRDLPTSSKSSAWQPTSVQMGLLGAIEPWNYDSGRNPIPLPIRGMLGFNLVNLSQTSFAPSVLAGISVTAPLIDAPGQLGTSIALGAYYEVDLRDSRPFKTGQRFLLTFGFNVLSLFGASK